MTHDYEALARLLNKWRNDAEGVDAMGYSQQADRIRDCATELKAALARLPLREETPEPPTDVCQECGQSVEDHPGAYCIERLQETIVSLIRQQPTPPPAAIAPGTLTTEQRDAIIARGNIMAAPSGEQASALAGRIHDYLKPGIHMFSSPDACPACQHIVSILAAQPAPAVPSPLREVLDMAWGYAANQHALNNQHGCLFEDCQVPWCVQAKATIAAATPPGSEPSALEAFRAGFCSFRRPSDDQWILADVDLSRGDCEAAYAAWNAALLGTAPNGAAK